VVRDAALDVGWVYREGRARRLIVDVVIDDEGMA
jgi:hypothetical protein